LKGLLIKPIGCGVNIYAGASTFIVKPRRRELGTEC